MEKNLVNLVLREITDFELGYTDSLDGEKQPEYFYAKTYTVELDCSVFINQIRKMESSFKKRSFYSRQEAIDGKTFRNKKSRLINRLN